MKTLKKLTEESKAFYTENAKTYFSRSYSKKMRGTQTITFENDFIPKIELDDREYYQGRGAKYNTNSMHEHIDTFVTFQEFTEKVKMRAKNLFEREKDKVTKRKKLREVCKINGLEVKNYTAVFGENGLFFEHSKQVEIEKELNVSLDDFFNATGKTYFFAESKIGLVLFYHNHRQSYSFEFTTKERYNEFQKNREDWISAPFAETLGQNTNPNLFVC